MTQTNTRVPAVVCSLNRRVFTDGTSPMNQLRKLQLSNSELFHVDNKVTISHVSEHDVLGFFGCMSLESYTQDEGSASRLWGSVSEPYSMENKVLAVGDQIVLECFGSKSLQDEQIIHSCENECLPSCLGMRHRAFQIRIDTILLTQNERLHDVVRHLAKPRNGKYWPEHFVVGMLKLQCDVSGADYALRWRYCAEKNGMVVVGYYVPLCRKRQTEGETGTRAFAHANTTIVLKSCEDSAVRRAYQSHKTILINVATCDFFVRTKMAMRHGIKSICFR